MGHNRHLFFAFFNSPNSFHFAILNDAAFLVSFQYYQKYCKVRIFVTKIIHYEVVPCVLSPVALETK